MDVRKTAREIGLFETGINLARVLDSPDVLAKVDLSMPLPDADIADSVPQIAAWLRGFGKRKYLFLTPEIALMEELAKLGDPQEEVILVIPHDLEADAKERIRNNLPRGIRVTALEEPDFPQSVFPSDSLMVVCGYSACGRPMSSRTPIGCWSTTADFWAGKSFSPIGSWTPPPGMRAGWKCVKTV